jgi:hypothetical protein
VKKPGDRVRLTEDFKKRMRGKCGEAGEHLGPWDPEGEDEQCWGCSSEHVEEFDQSVGVIEGLADYNNCKPGEPGYDPAKVGPEWTVRWEPDNLRYHYADSDLEPAP